MIVDFLFLIVQRLIFNPLAFGQILMDNSRFRQSRQDYNIFLQLVLKKILNLTGRVINLIRPLGLSIYGIQIQFLFCFQSELKQYIISSYNNAQPYSIISQIYYNNSSNMTFLARKIVQTTGLPLDQIKLILSQVYSILLCFLFHRITSKSMRKYFSLVFGTLLQIYVFKDYFYQYIFLAIQIGVVYWICLNFRKNCGYIVTVESMIVISFCHIYRMIINYGGWELDISTVLMIMVGKFSYFAYQYEDGGKTGEKYEKLNQQQKTARLETLPSFFDYICYLQFLPTSVMGPALDYYEYSSFINREREYSSIPNTQKIMFKTLAESGMCLVIYLGIYSPFFPVQFMTTETFFSWNPWKMFLYSYVSVTLMRFRYYFAWKLNTCAVHASGLSYETTIVSKNGQQEHVFSRHTNANVFQVEGTPHVKHKIANWNIAIQKWLKRCVYERTKLNGQFITFMVSAFWHGFYGGYYFSFFLWFVMVFLAQLVYRLNINYPIVQKYWKKTGAAGKILLWLFINMVFSNCGSYFAVLSLKTSWRMLVAYKFIPVLILIIPTLILQFSGLCKRKSKKIHPQNTKDSKGQTIEMAQLPTKQD